MKLDRDLFLTAHRTKLFTAEEVLKFIEIYSPTSAEQELKLFDEILEWWEKFGDDAILGFVKARKHRLERELRSEARR